MIDVFNDIEGNKDQKGNDENMLGDNVFIGFVIKREVQHGSAS
jgi:hypothetical protein